MKNIPNINPRTDGYKYKMRFCIDLTEIYYFIHITQNFDIFIDLLQNKILLHNAIEIDIQNIFRLLYLSLIHI